MKTKMMGERSCLEKELKVLNRTIKWETEGISYEADNKHVQSVAKALNMEHCRFLSAPGAKRDEKRSDAKGETEMSPSEATKYRAAVAKCNYLAADRPEIQFATKECCKRMSSPKWSDWDLLKHEVRYLAGMPSAIQWFRWKPECSGKIVAMSDSDWAGCRDTRKPTSGGCIVLNGHLLKSWSEPERSGHLVGRSRA